MLGYKMQTHFSWSGQVTILFVWFSLNVTFYFSILSSQYENLCSLNQCCIIRMQQLGVVSEYTHFQLFSIIGFNQPAQKNTYWPGPVEHILHSALLGFFDLTIYVSELGLFSRPVWKVMLYGQHLIRLEFCLGNARLAVSLQAERTKVLDWTPPTHQWNTTTCRSTALAADLSLWSWTSSVSFRLCFCGHRRVIFERGKAFFKAPGKIWHNTTGQCCNTILAMAYLSHKSSSRKYGWRKEQGRTREMSLSLAWSVPSFPLRKVQPQTGQAVTGALTSHCTTLRIFAVTQVTDMQKAFHFL